eukprot:g974.t1
MSMRSDELQFLKSNVYAAAAGPTGGECRKSVKVTCRCGLDTRWVACSSLAVHRLLAQESETQNNMSPKKKNTTDNQGKNLKGIHQNDDFSKTRKHSGGEPPPFHDENISYPYDATYLCDRVCGSKMMCGKHICDRVCCPMSREALKIRNSQKNKKTKEKQNQARL